MRDTYVLGISMTRFGKYIEKSLQELAYGPIWEAIGESEVDPHDIGIIFAGNAYGGLITGQESVRGQVIMREAGIGDIPIINVENACASGSTALYLAHGAVASGEVDLALAVGVEKLFCGDTGQSLKALSTSADLEIEGRMGILFAGIYAMRVRAHMEQYGITREQLALTSVKNHDHGALNPHAQYRERTTVDEVLNSRMIADPITLLMTCPLGDGAAAALIGTKEMALRMEKRPVKIRASVLGSFGFPGKDGPSIAARVAKRAYKETNIEPKDVQVAELHDAVSPVELYLYEELGFCGPGESGRMIQERKTWYDGPLPVNTSGGLTAKGHPAGATGLAQVAEIVWQMRGEAGERQMSPLPHIGLVENGGGNVGGETAVVAVHILEARE
ncbi:MAG: thiolase family protein [Deltaproteobacteria bacterium]|nr:thiolase family protein [Deltaproteobacteria bacterium]MBW2137223.1 thiolase family protein [Deltaproteobacteria bacterium]